MSEVFLEILVNSFLVPSFLLANVDLSRFNEESIEASGMAAHLKVS